MHRQPELARPCAVPPHETVVSPQMTSDAPVCAHTIVIEYTSAEAAYPLGAAAVKRGSVEGCSALVENCHRRRPGNGVE